jgi:2,3-bisphosphoglycerate-dependent phosphoglycerate mutase
MKKKIYVVRHCKAEGQEPEAPLTPAGQQQAEALAEFFEETPIDRIISSPYARALGSVGPLSQRRRVPVEQDERLAERVLSTQPIPDWYERLRDSFDDLHLCYEGGESSHTAMKRAVEVVHEVLASDATNTVLVSHGCLITLLLKHFDERFGFAEWESLTNPDVFVLTVEQDKLRVDRLWKPL